MKLQLDTDETGQLIAVDQNWKLPKFTGDTCHRLPDTRIPITVNPDGTLDRESNYRILGLNQCRAYFTNHSVKSCYWCGTKFIGGPRSKHCSDRCIQSASASRIKAARKWGLRNRKCEACGVVIDPQRKTRKFCSNACRQKAHRNATNKPTYHGKLIS